jgi:hypothetical protein
MQNYFEIGCQFRTNFVKDKTGDPLADSQNILIFRGSSYVSFWIFMGLKKLNRLTYIQRLHTPLKQFFRGWDYCRKEIQMARHWSEASRIVESRKWNITFWDQKNILFGVWKPLLCPFMNRVIQLTTWIVKASQVINSLQICINHSSLNINFMDARK